MTGKPTYEELEKRIRNLEGECARNKGAESELRFQSLIFQNMAEGVVLIRTSDGIIVYTNPVFERIFGYKPEELIGKHIRVVNPPGPRSPENMAEDIIASLKKEGVWRGDVMNVRKDGSVFWSHAKVSTFEHPHYGVVWVSVHEDITERKRMEETLRQSEERWQFALEGAGDGVWDWNAVTNEVFFSRQWKAMLGFEDHEIANTLEEWDRRVHPEDKERVYEDINRHFSGQTPVYTNEHRVLCKDGSYKWILDRGKVISRTPEGNPLRVIGTHTDITERKEVEAEVKKAHERLEVLLYSLPLGIVVIEEESHRIIDVNPQAVLMFGAPVEEILGKSCHAFICPTEEGKCPVTDLGKHMEASERILLTFDGRKVPILKTVLRLELDGKRCLIESFSDISEIKQAELERREREKLQAVVEMAGAVCHEMNQPLMAISGYSELLQTEVTENDHAFQHARKIIAQVERMGEITRKMMRITSHRTKKYLDTKILDINGASETLE